jgi:hypothetical protein
MKGYRDFRRLWRLWSSNEDSEKGMSLYRLGEPRETVRHGADCGLL